MPRLSSRIPFQPPGSTHRFTSASAFFARARALRASEHALPCPIRNGGIYIVRGRPVRLSIESGHGAGHSPRVRLLRTDWSALTRRQRWLAICLSLVGLDLRACTEATPAQARRTVKLLNEREQAAALLARDCRARQSCHIGTIRNGSRSTAAIDDAELRLAASLAEEFAPRLWECAHAVDAAERYLATPAGEEHRKRILAEIVAPVRQQLHLRVQGLRAEHSRITVGAVLQAFEASEPWSRLIAEDCHGAGVRLLEALKLKAQWRRQPDPAAQGSRPVVADVICAPRGNPFPVLRDLLHAGLLRWTPDQQLGTEGVKVKRRLSDWIGGAEKGELHPDDLAQALRECLQPTGRRQKVILNGDILACDGNDPLPMLATLGFLTRAGVAVEFLLSADDAAILKYYLENRGTPETGKWSSQRGAVLADGSTAVVAGLHLRLHGVDGRQVRAQFRRGMESVYLPRVSLLAVDSNAELAITQGLVDAGLFRRLCDEANATQEPTLEDQVRGINTWLRQSVLRDDRSLTAGWHRGIADACGNANWGPDRKQRTERRPLGNPVLHPRLHGVLHRVPSLQASAAASAGTPAQHALLSWFALAENRRAPAGRKLGQLLAGLHDAPASFQLLAARLVLRTLRLAAENEQAPSPAAASALAACSCDPAADPFDSARLERIGEELARCWSSVLVPGSVTLAPTLAPALLRAVVRVARENDADSEQADLDAWQNVRDLLLDLRMRAIMEVGPQLEQAHAGTIGQDAEFRLLHRMLRPVRSHGGPVRGRRYDAQPITLTLYAHAAQ
ncbi:hypothetical protein [Cupriavidus sp. AU9028]|uniref:hypothetical protein n=1 Tax=Cupriavidus sp. AU9028 TaxID=2871157 RepID=UPI001C965E11|nr:hypothetical protein [Cupriavidus sp. AU9028]MBY4895964.1 hypothetical protein [Cupriavidus sp. AU9028]